MRIYLRSIASLLLLLTFGSAPTFACMMHAPLDLADVKYADVVVIGRISNYQINGGGLGGYATFNVTVDQLLVGTAPQTFKATWDNSTFAEPDSLPSESMLIALRDPRSGMPPLRGPSATILPNPEPNLLTVLQAPCSDAFIFPSSSDEARTILKTLQP